MSWHPWRTLRHHPEITLRWERLPGLLGTWHHTSKTITLHPDQSQAERRCTLTHEHIHYERGDRGPCDGRTERVVHGLAARRLIPLDSLVDALLWSSDDHELAEELWVDVPTLRARLDGLTEMEHAFIAQRLWEAEPHAWA
jgi:hypothetical protein